MSTVGPGEGSKPSLAVRLRSENQRGWLAALLAVLAFAVLVAVIMVPLTLLDVLPRESEGTPASGIFGVLGALSIWISLMLAQVIMVLYAFGRLSGEELRSAAIHGRRSKPDSLVGPVTPAALAVLAVAALISLPSLRSLPGVVPTVLVLVICCWVSIMIHFALEYAEQDATDVRFPEDRPDRPFSDFVYLAFAVQSTFGTTDVEIRSSKVRRRVTAHGMIAFTYNTLIITMIIALVIG